MPGYTYEKRKDGTLIRGVRVVKPIARGERDELRLVGKELDERFLQSATSKFKPDASSGEVFSVTLGHRGERIGRILGQRVVSHAGKPTAELDILLSDEQAQKDWHNGLLPELSADIDLSGEKIYAVSVLKKGHGHFGKDDLGTHFFPADMQLALSNVPQTDISIKCEPAPAAKETTMELTQEQIDTITNAVIKGVTPVINQVVDAKVAPVLELAKKQAANTDPLDPANDIIKAREQRDAAIRDNDAKHKLELEKEKDISNKLAEAAQVDVGLPQAAYRKQLELRDTQARADYHRLMLERARNSKPTVQPGDDPDNRNKTRAVLELEADFDKDKAYWEGLKVSKDDYVQQRLRKRAQREAKTALVGSLD